MTAGKGKGNDASLQTGQEIYFIMTVDIHIDKQKTGGTKTKIKDVER